MTNATATRQAAYRQMIASQKAYAKAERAEAAECRRQEALAKQMNKAGCTIKAIKKACPMVGYYVVRGTAN